MSEILDTLLTQTASARILVKLLDGRMFRTQLQRGPGNPGGVAWPDAFKNARNLLLKFDLVEQEPDPQSKTPRPRLYLELTELGRTVAEHLKAIQDLLMSP